MGYPRSAQTGTGTGLEQPREDPQPILATSPVGPFTQTSYEVRSGRRTIALQKASTAQEALIEYLRATGCHLDEISRVGAAAVAWRGAVYSAVPAETNS
jgi:hypothetical protein